MHLDNANRVLYGTSRFFFFFNQFLLMKYYALHLIRWQYSFLYLHIFRFGLNRAFGIFSMSHTSHCGAINWIKLISTQQWEFPFSPLLLAFFIIAYYYEKCLIYFWSHYLSKKARMRKLWIVKKKRIDFESIIESEDIPINRFWISNRFPSPTNNPFKEYHKKKN